MEILAGTIDEIIENNNRRIVKHGDIEIGVLHRNGEFYAYRNLCFHQGGPACEGMTIGKVEDIIAPDGTMHGQRFSLTETHFVCPWHGYEYDLRTGECVADRRKKLQNFAVVTKGNDVYVIV